MATQTKKQKKPKKKKTTKKTSRSSKNGKAPKWIETLRKVAHGTVGIGNMVPEVAIDEFFQSMQDYTQTLIDWGEITQKDGRKLVSDIRERRKKLMADIETRIEKRLDGRVGRILDKAKTPAKKQFDKLSSRVESLTKKIDKWLLKGTKTKSTKTTAKKKGKKKTKTKKK